MPAEKNNPAEEPLTELEQTIGKCQESPIFFIECCWGLTPQILICDKEHKHIFLSCYSEFQKDKNITWQQAEVLRALEDAVANNGSRRISVASGNNIGKSCLAAWCILWFLLTNKQAQVSVTSPSQSQLYDVLWKEAKLWLDKMTPGLRAFYDWSQTHIRMLPSPNTWFARAATARKETPEAFSGIHGESVFLIAEEASGIDDVIYTTAEGTLASPNSLVLLISNPLRTEGYFYETFTKNNKYWRNFNFSSAESPIVPESFIEIKAADGIDSDAYKIFVLGQFPDVMGIDEQGWLPLFHPNEIRQVPDDGKLLSARMGVDPAGEGSNESIWVARDQFRAKIVSVEKFSSDKSVAERTITLMGHYGTNESNVIIDNFGRGANVSQEIALAEQHFKISAVNVGGPSSDPKSYLNLRAEAYLRLRDWIRSGGELVRNEKWKQLLDIRYKRNLSGKYQIISKLELQKRGIKSPDAADALALTFVDGGLLKSSKRTVRGLSTDEISNLSNVYN